MDLQLDKRGIIIYDIESDGFFTTTGWTRPIEFACIHITPQFEFKVISFLIKRRSNQELPETIQNLTGLTTHQLNTHGLDIVTAFRYLANLFKPVHDLPPIVVGHNIIRFDNKMMNQRFIKYGHNEITLEQSFDTAGKYKMDKLGIEQPHDVTHGEMHKKAVYARGSKMKFSIDHILETNEYDVPEDLLFDRHRALCDVLVTTNIFRKQCYSILSDDMLHISYKHLKIEDYVNLHDIKKGIPHI